MFGWDWGARLPDAGIWRGISIEGVNDVRLISVIVEQRHQTGSVEIVLKPEIEYTGDIKPDCTLETEITRPDGRVTRFEGQSMVIDDPEYWWPNGLGAHPLYTICSRLMSNGEICGVWEGRVGLRTLKVRREKDKWGESFEFCVNGVSVFAMGGDYIPQDSVLARVTRDKTLRLLSDCASAHHNCVRVWGGGIYPEDYFYDICDELGLIVWQDFMFACAMYDLTIPFAENIVREVEDNARRLRHHASLGLWCANNELEWQVADKCYDATPKQNADYIRLFEYLIPNTLRKIDPFTDFWPSSPSSGGGFDAPNDPNRGDCHYWEVWHSDKPFTEYRKYFFRFASEFGFQSFPCLKTVESFTEPGDRNIFSYVMERHQRNSSANGKIMNYIAQNFLYPKDFDSLLYASQMLQAQAIRYGVEHWRRNRGRCMGAVYWQINDCWPVASWSSIDYYGRWKALHYFSKRFFAPVLLSCLDEGALSQQTNVNAQGYKILPSARLCVTNDTLKDVECLVSWSVRNAVGEEKRSGRENVTCPALKAVWLEKTDLGEIDIYGDYLWYELEADGKTVSGGAAVFCAEKHFKFRDPRLTATYADGRVIVRSEAFARGVELISDGDVLFEDNYFDMNPGIREINVLRGIPANLRARSVYNIAN